jgi:hypothetical protein
MKKPLGEIDKIIYYKVYCTNCGDVILAGYFAWDNTLPLLPTSLPCLTCLRKEDRSTRIHDLVGELNDDY